MGSMYTVALSGFDRGDESQFRAWFEQVNEELGSPYALVEDPHADILVIDIDSIYGQMDWLRTQGSGRCVVAHTAGSRADGAHRLPRPLNVEDIRHVLHALTQSQAPPERSVPAAQSAAAEQDVSPVLPAQRSEHANVGSRQQQNLTRAPDLTDPEENSPSATVQNTPQPPPIDDSPSPPSVLLDYLQPGALRSLTQWDVDGRLKLILDPATQTYWGCSTLKPLVAGLTQSVQPDALVAMDAAAMTRQPPKDQPPLPWSRLRWLAALYAGQGSVIGFAPQQMFKLARWPQIEREFPRHFRIATALMRQPSMVDEIAAQSGASSSEVADFVNAYLLTGHVEAEGIDEAQMAHVRNSLLARLRPAA